MSLPSHQTQDWASDAGVLICLVTVPVLSRSAETAVLVPPTIGVYASLRPGPASRGPQAQGSASSKPADQAGASLDQAVADATHAGCVASLSAWRAERGTVSRGRAEADADAAEAARAQAGELAIASALAQEERLSAQIATLERQRAQAEMRASVASLLMARNAEVGAAKPSQAPMFALAHDGAPSTQAWVFEEDLMRLVAGLDVTLSSKDPVPAAAARQAGEVAIDLRARLEPASTSARDPSRLVQGMFLSVELVGIACGAAPAIEPGVGARSVSRRSVPARARTILAAGAERRPAPASVSLQ